MDASTSECFFNKFINIVPIDTIYLSFPLYFKVVKSATLKV